MKTVIISDIHSNYEALKVLEDLLLKADIVICAGDFTGYYCQVNECIDFMKNINVKAVLGNHDYFVLEPVPYLLFPTL